MEILTPNNIYRCNGKWTVVPGRFSYDICGITANSVYTTIDTEYMWNGHIYEWSALVLHIDKNGTIILMGHNE